MAASEEQLLSLEDVASRLQVSDQTVRRWIKSGKLAAYKPGLEWRIKPSDLEEFLQARSSPKGVRRSSLEPSLFNGLEEERHAEWENAVSSARQLREHGQGRAEELLALWRQSKDREEDPAARQPYLDKLGELLQEAYDAETALVNALSDRHLAEQWPEVQKADRFYIELWRLVQEAGLNIHTDGEQAADRVQSEKRPNKVEEPKAA